MGQTTHEAPDQVRCAKLETDDKSEREDDRSEFILERRQAGA